MLIRPGTLAALVLAALALLVAGCGSDEKSPSGSGATATTPTPTATEDSEAEQEREAKAGSKDCDKVGDLEGKPKLEPPSDLRLPGDAHVYESEGPFGKTTRFFAATDGGAEDLPRIRDDASDALVENGYELLSKDQEEGAEAEAHLSGRHAVDIQVIKLCAGKLRIRYTVS